MNKTEAAWAVRLDVGKLAGQINWWSFEAVKIRLAQSTFYTPDFMVWLPDGSIRFDEVKGFWRDDARVKIKVVAEMYPFWAFQAVSRHKGSWKIETFASRQKAYQRPSS